MRNLPPCEAVRWQMQQTGATSCRWTRCLLGANTCLIHSRVSLVEAGVRRLLTTLRGLHEARMASITVPSLHGADSSLPASRAWLATAAAMAACARIGAAAPQRSRRVGAQSAAVAAEMYNHLLGLRSVLTRVRSAVLGPRLANAVPILSTCARIANSPVLSARLLFMRHRGTARENKTARRTVLSLHGANSSPLTSRVWLAMAAAVAASARMGAAAPRRSRGVGTQSAAVAAEMYNHLLGLRSVLTRHRSAVLGPRPASAVPILSTCTRIASSHVVSARLRLPVHEGMFREIRTARRTVPSLHGASSSRPTSRAWLAMAAAAAASVQIGAAAPRQSLSVGTRSAADVSIVIRECPPFR
mmetsp:Transcript_49657/g.125102  ORF Transcript_49657/g.125102 Transcript_49657/m.125102 type:complete len:359 (+) Transcript_49657:175-1251(+)